MKIMLRGILTMFILIILAFIVIFQILTFIYDFLKGKNCMSS